MKHMVSYTLKPECVADNERLAKAVYDELHSLRPVGLRYATFRVGDGVSFVHIVSYDDGSTGKLTALPAFQAFAAGVKDRCATPPLRVDLAEIGSYGFFDR